MTQALPLDGFRVVDYSHFLAGPFIKESGPGNDVDYATSWVTYKF